MLELGGGGGTAEILRYCSTPSTGEGSVRGEEKYLRCCQFRDKHMLAGSLRFLIVPAFYVLYSSTK